MPDELTYQTTINELLEETKQLGEEEFNILRDALKSGEENTRYLAASILVFNSNKLLKSTYYLDYDLSEDDQDRMKSIFNQVIQTENDSSQSFIAAMALCYLGQSPTEKIVTILAENTSRLDLLRDTVHSKLYVMSEDSTTVELIRKVVPKLKQGLSELLSYTPENFPVSDSVKAKAKANAEAYKDGEIDYLNDTSITINETISIINDNVVFLVEFIYNLALEGDNKASESLEKIFLEQFKLKLEKEELLEYIEEGKYKLNIIEYTNTYYQYFDVVPFGIGDFIGSQQIKNAYIDELKEWKEEKESEKKDKKKT
ncbi:hypothetical protein [Limnoraphis robusta]|uniref:Uncharacterized protein n=1 Tax=Limnoraphis robusta CCNP1315 TaxID=3110306 RepID=A0ABU5U1G3_9CYAN|nr:hypothetical protein [Limnoraphis robusta]MEA5521030.1 hypothetical protein [Limnoraphis robusta CCNP1315]MEA5543525.1 hypothetical protein [Limnoraphis robusta CCNP1324]